MDKTAVVEISRTYRHMLYQKLIHSYKRVMAHDELGCEIGDHVRIVESQPISRHKHWVVEEILRRDIAAGEPEIVEFEEELKTIKEKPEVVEEHQVAEEPELVEEPQFAEEPEVVQEPQEVGGLEMVAEPETGEGEPGMAVEPEIAAEAPGSEVSEEETGTETKT